MQVSILPLAPQYCPRTARVSSPFLVTRESSPADGADAIAGRAQFVTDPKRRRLQEEAVRDDGDLVVAAAAGLMAAYVPVQASVLPWLACSA